MDAAIFPASGPVVTSNRILYTPSDFARSSLLNLQEIGTLEAGKAHENRRQGLASCLFFVVHSGSGFLTFEGEDYPLSPGDCVFIDCRRPYAHRTPGEDGQLWSLSWVHFTGISMAGIYGKYLERGGRAVFRPEDIAPYLDLFSKLMAVAGSDDKIRDMRINEHLSALLTLIMSESWHPERAGARAVKRRSVQPVAAYLAEHFAEPVTLDELSERFYINKYYLARVFREYMGISIGTYIRSLRITRAKQLLRFSDLSAEEIGEITGFGALNYFSRAFKEVEGIPPSVFRRQWREQGSTQRKPI